MRLQKADNLELKKKLPGGVRRPVKIKMLLAMPVC